MNLRCLRGLLLGGGNLAVCAGGSSSAGHRGRASGTHLASGVGLRFTTTSEEGEPEGHNERDEDEGPEGTSVI